MKKIYYALVLTALSIFSGACSKSEIEDALDSVDVDRKKIDVSRLGLNSFGNDQVFGSPCQQFAEARDVLGVKFLRILINWNTAVQSSASSAPVFGFYDELISCIPDGVDALLVVNGLPGWMYDSKNWIGGNPRATFVELWFKKVFRRYSDNPKVLAFQIWNEPNMLSNVENQVLEIAESPVNYLEMLAASYSLAKGLNSSKLIVNAATTAINQGYPNTLQYNKRLRDAGGDSFVDRWAIHYYGTSYERVGDVAGFLNELPVGIWLTESGDQGINNQHKYVEETWPFLDEKINNLERFYYYQHTSVTSPESAYGLRNPSAETPVSDLYIYLRDKKNGLVE